MPRKLIWTALHRVMPARVEGSDVRATGGPWTLSGVPDSDLDDVERQNNHRLLTDPSLAARHRHRFPDRPFADYDEMIRALGYVWDCRHDRTINVTGYRCASCGEQRSTAGG
jgi:hypothetical protein